MSSSKHHHREGSESEYRPNYEYTIRLAQPSDFSVLPAIESSAAALFASLPELLHFATNPPSFTEEKARDLCQNQGGRVWVAIPSTATTTTATTSDLDSANAESVPVPVPVPVPVGFIAAVPLDECWYIIEISVHADAQRRGIAAKLIRTVLEFAAASAASTGPDGRKQKVSLITDRVAPWNGPMYKLKFGFREILSVKELGPGHVRVWEEEEKDGMDMGRRVAMVRDPDPI